MAALPQSPVTGVIDEKQVIVEFGKWEGKTVKEVSDLDPGLYTRFVNERENGTYAIRRHRDKSFRLYQNPTSYSEV